MIYINRKIIMLQKIIDFLKKIGVISAGTQTWKGDAKDRPASMIGDEVDLQQMQKENEEKKKQKS